MNVDEFVSLVASEEPFSEERIVKIRGPALEAELATRSGASEAWRDAAA
jgi:hypothetical protein